ncbi:extracellular solute-binding protein [Paenibacillus sp. HB172176]|uniref:extracellular solute-binding protein n=1 Tax=Paenibacillus sp. HB172176 TaxID=2493690 RepID=UPI0014399449|nr:extracellular solute-binding protein [Paenibacillus sp. HB172176]
MSNKGSKALILGLGLMTLLSACSSGNDAPSRQSGTTDGGKKAAPVKLTMMVQNHPAMPLNPDWPIYDWLGENANVELEVSGFQGNWWEAIPLVIASGDMPDMMWMSGPDIVNKSGEDGALVNLLDYRDIMPNLQAFMEQHPAETEALLSSEGKLFMHPAYGPFGDVDSMLVYRKDVFDKHSLKEPQTYDELFDVLMKLKSLYPDSYPLFIEGLGDVNRLALSFGLGNSLYYDEADQSWKYAPAEANFEKLLSFMANAYANKLIPQEFGNMDMKKRNELIAKDEIFVSYAWFEQGDFTFFDSLKSSNPDFRMIQLTPPSGDGHTGYHTQQYLYQEGLTVTTTSKHKEEALRFIDSLFTEKARDLMSWGKEGVTYEVKDGMKQYLPVVKDAAFRSNEYGIRTSAMTAWFDNDANIALMSEDEKESYMEAVKHLAPAPRSVALSKQERDAISLKMTSIDKYYQENVSKMIVGQLPLAQWDDYVQGLYDLGLNDVLDVYNEASKRAWK